LQSFERCLLVERGLAEGTVHGYVEHARRFLAGLDREGGLGSLSAADVTSAVLHESAAASVATTHFLGTPRVSVGPLSWISGSDALPSQTSPFLS